MILKKSEHVHKLKKHIEILNTVYITNSFFYSYMLIRDRKDIIDAIEKDPNLEGLPAYISLYNNLLYVFPKPDKDYKCTILGMVTIEQ